MRIEGNDSKTHVLNENGIDITVNGASWGKAKKPNISPTSSYTWASSPEYKVTAPVDAPLDFVKNSNWNIGDTLAGQAITPFSVASGAIGGTKPYTFSKVSGPAWLKVSSDGMVSGTPTLVGSNVGLRIRVTDKTSATKEILLQVGSTNVVPGERVKITDVVATSNTDSIPGYGKSFLSPTFTVTEGAPANFKYSTGAWYKKNGGGIGKSIHNQNL